MTGQASCVAVLVKSVPVGGAFLRPVDGRLSRDGLPHGLDPVNEVAVEWSVRLRETGAIDRVVAISMGPADAGLALRRAIALGCDEAVHVCDPELAGSEVRRTAAVLAASVRLVGAALAVLGYESLDGSSGALPGALAALLGWPLVSRARHAQLADRSALPDGSVTVERDVGKGPERVCCGVPAVLSFVDGAVTPRYPKLKEVIAARSAPLRTLTAKDLGLRGAHHTGMRERTLRLEMLPDGDRQPRVVGLNDGVEELYRQLVQVGAAGG